MGSAVAYRIWLVSGPLLLFGLALKYPLQFILTVIVAWAFGVVVSQRLNGYKRNSVIIIVTYIALLIEWIAAVRIWDL